MIELAKILRILRSCSEKRLFYYQVKQEENEAALLLLSKRLKELDALPWGRRQLALIEGIIAGNVFDWGAKEVAK